MKLRKGLMYLMAFVLILSGLFVAGGNKAEAASTTTKFASSDTPLKSSAKSSSKTLVNVKKHATVQAYTKTVKGSYLKAKVSGKTGWILKSKLAETKTMYAKSDSTKVRKTASSKAGVVTTAKKNASVIVTDVSGSWYKVKVNGKSGYAASSELTSTVPVTSKTQYVTGNTTLKATASSKGKNLITVKKDAAITVYSTTSGSYVKAKTSGKTGWILKSKVRDTKTVNTVKKEYVNYKTVKEYNPDMFTDEKKVWEKGVKGQNQVTYQTQYKNGKVVFQNKKISTKVMSKPLNEVIMVGTLIPGNYLNRAYAWEQLFNGEVEYLRNGTTGGEFNVSYEPFTIVKIGKKSTESITMKMEIYLRYLERTKNNGKALKEKYGNELGEKNYKRMMESIAEMEKAIKVATETVFGDNRKESKTLYNEIMKVTHDRKYNGTKTLKIGNGKIELKKYTTVDVDKIEYPHVVVTIK